MSQQIARISRSVTVICAVLTFFPAAAKAAKLRFAVALERPRDIVASPKLGDTAGTTALLQGVREACIDSGTMAPKRPTPVCRVLADLPTSGVCIYETVEHLQSADVRCAESDVAVETIDLSSATCSTGPCFRTEAERAGASHLLLVDARYSQTGVQLKARVIELATGKTNVLVPSEFAEDYDIEAPRTGTQALGILKWFGREVVLAELVARQKQEVAERAAGGASGKADATAPAPRAVSTEAFPLPPMTSPTAPAAPVDGHGSATPSWIGWSLIAAAAAAGLGSWLVWRAHGDGDHCAGAADADPCRGTRRTLIPAIGLAAGSAVALSLGTFFVVRDRRGDVALSLHALGFGVGGMF